MEYQIQIPERLRRSATVSTTSEIEAVEMVRRYHKEAYYKSPNNDFILAHGDCFKLLKEFDFKFDMIFADPPYFLSNGGISLQSGKVVCVDKGDFTYSTEFVIWARKMPKVAHKFNYDLMKKLNDGKQMTDVWRMPAIGRWEKTCGKHPTQKPLRLLVRMILASTNEGDWILDPFCGSSTTGIAANLCGRRFAGLEQEEEFCKLSKARREEIEDPEKYNYLISHIEDLQKLPDLLKIHGDDR